MVARFIFETITDLSVVPSLFLIFQRQKHFDFFIGVMQFLVSLCYNICDSLDVDIFLSKTAWHQLTNVFGLSYGVNVLVFLSCNTSEGQDHFFRYTAFALLWICQIKDEYWMEKCVKNVFFFLVNLKIQFQDAVVITLFVAQLACCNVLKTGRFWLFFWPLRWRW
jgi:hypothetical protein